MRLLLVASDPREFSGIVAHATDVRPVRLPLDWARSARLGAHEVLLVANGVGWKRAGAAVDASVARFQPEGVISTGFCGALADDLGIADVVVATRVMDPQFVTPALVPSGPLPLHTGTIYSINHVARNAAEKRTLRASGACAVEMEAGSVAACARSLEIPFYCIKAVTDLAGETMANDFNAALRADGHFDTMLILRRMLHRPTERLPELLRLRNRCARAARVLGDFLAECRF